MKIVFTKHAKNRLEKRKITKQEVINAIKHADETEKKDNKYYVKKNIGKGNIEIVYEKDNYIKVITVYWLE